MKKLVFLLFILLALNGFVSSQTAEEDGDILVSSNVSKHIYIMSMQDLSFGPLNTSGANSSTGIIYIRSNHESWTFKVYAEKGALTEWDTALSSYVSGGETIPYTFTFNGRAATPEERIIGQTVPTTSAAALTASFSEKTKFGSNGEPFSYTVDIAGLPGGANWGAGTYHDVLYMSVSAN